MSADPFNVIGGYAVGIPPKLVVDQNGNVVNNVNAPNANVTANRVFANSYFFANGVPLSIGAAGSNTQVQYNSNGLLGASAGFTFNSASNLLTVTNLNVSNRANLGQVGNVVILGGTNGYFLQTDGSGNLTWAPAGNGGNGGNGSPAGANTQVQFNDAGVFGGDAGFTYNKTTNILAVDNINTGNLTANFITTTQNISANILSANFIYGDGSNLTDVAAATANVANSVAGANVTGEVNFANVANNVAGANVLGQVNFANVANNVAGANVLGQVGNALVASTVYSNTQPNITSVGNLVSLTVIGNANLGNQTVSNYFIGNLYGTANLARNVTYSAQPNITSLGILTTLEVSGNTVLGNTVTSNYFIGNLYGVANSALIANTANLAILANNANQANTANLAGTVSVNAQPNITSLGTLTALNVTGVSNLGPVGNVTITGGTNGYVLSTDGLGNLSWITQSGNGNANPGGSNTQIQFNNNGSFGGSPDFTYNDSTKYFYLGGNANINGIVNAKILTSNISTGSAPLVVLSTTPVANLGVETADKVRNAAQPNITSVGTLTNLSVSGTINTFDATVSNLLSITGNLSAGNFSTPGLISTSRLTVTSNANLNGATQIGSAGVLNVIGNINATTSGNVTLGNISNIHISGGVNGYVLTTDGTGNLSWSAGGGGGNGTPGGSNTQIQFNDSGTFAGSTFFTFDKATNNVQIAGNLIANSITVGSGIYQFSYSNVYSATTNSTVPNQVLLAIEADNGVGGGNVAAVDYTIISTDGIIRNFVKISCVRMNSTVNYVEYSTLPVNGYTGDFEVTYDAGNVLVPATIQLVFSPQTANFMIHKMMVTSYYD